MERVGATIEGFRQIGLRCAKGPLVLGAFGAPVFAGVLIY